MSTTGTERDAKILQAIADNWSERPLKNMPTRQAVRRIKLKAHKRAMAKVKDNTIWNRDKKEMEQS